MMRRAVIAVSAVMVGLTIATPSTAAQRSCPDPTVNALSKAEAAVSRPVLDSPAEYGLSNVYATVEQATRPRFTYAEAGPQYAGVFESLLPVGSPTLIRSVSASPSTDIPDRGDTDWGPGTSHTEVSPTSAAARSSGVKELGVGGATAEDARAWVLSTIECDVVTVIAGWLASGVTLAPGVTAEELGETVTVVVGPTGGVVTSRFTMVGVAGAETVPVTGRPADAFTDPMREGGGPRLEAGEPRANADAKGARVSGGGINVRQNDPSTGQGAGYRIGSINASIAILGALVAPGATASAPASPPPALTPSAGRMPRVVGSGSAGDTVILAENGVAPAPSEQAVAVAETLVSAQTAESISVTDRTTFWLFLSIAAGVLIRCLAASSPIWRRRSPTLDWVVRKLGRRGQRFASLYLRW